MSVTFAILKAENVKMLKHYTYAFKTNPLTYIIFISLYLYIISLYLYIPSFHDFEADVSEYSFI